MLDISSLSTLNLERIDDEFLDRNVGQYLGTIGNGIRICKHQKGIPPSVISFYKGRPILMPSMMCS